MLKSFSASSIWTIAGFATFVCAGVALGTGRFGAGVLLLAASAVCLGTAMGSRRRQLKKQESQEL